jgi:hypothetical protein
MKEELFSVKVLQQEGNSTRVEVFNRGNSAGTLSIATKDLGEFVRRMSGSAVVSQNIDEVGPGATVIGARIGRIG